MIRKIIAYDLDQLEKRHVYSHCKMLFKSNLLSAEQLENIETEYKTDFYAPKLIMRILLFLGTLLGVSTLSGPIALILESTSESVIRGAVVLFGLGIIFFCEKALIVNHHHFRSGVVEALIYVGALFCYFGILGFDDHGALVYAVFGLAISSIISIRYLDRMALFVSVLFFGWTLFETCMAIGSGLKAALPFIFIIAFTGVYFSAKKREAKYKHIAFIDHFILLKSLALLMIYIAGNYFVVRELSIELMELQITDGADIPMAWFFIGYTIALPLLYLFIGIKSKSILFIRISLLVLALGVATIKMYFSLGAPVVTITVAGALLTAISLLVLNHLKTMKNGFTRDKILSDKWDSEDISAYVISQTTVNVAPTQSEDDLFQGGKFGGGGAGSNF